MKVDAVGDPYKVQLTHKIPKVSFKEEDYTQNPLLSKAHKWLDLALKADRQIDDSHKELIFRAEMDSKFMHASLLDFNKRKDQGDRLLLKEQTIELLEDAGFSAYLPLALPCNDAALSYGQAAEVAAREANR